MTVAILHVDNKTTVKIIYTDLEKNELSSKSNIEFLHTDNISVIDSSVFKKQVIALLNNIEFLNEK